MMAIADLVGYPVVPGYLVMPKPPAPVNRAVVLSEDGEHSEGDAEQRQVGGPTGPRQVDRSGGVVHAQSVGQPVPTRRMISRSYEVHRLPACHGRAFKTRTIDSRKTGG